MGVFEEIMSKLHLLKDEEIEKLNKELLHIYRDRKRLIDSAKATFLKRGEKVNWKSRDGFIRNATIIRVNQRTCTVKNENDHKDWLVGFSYIEKGWI